MSEKEQIDQLEARLREAQAFASISLLVAERMIAEMAADRASPDRFLAELHSDLRNRLAPAAAQQPKPMRDQMYGTLEAVFLHAAQAFRQTN